MSKDKATKQAKPETAVDAKPPAPAPQAPAAEAAPPAAPSTEPTNSPDATTAQAPVVTQPTTDEAAATVPEAKGNPPPVLPPAASLKLPKNVDDSLTRYHVLTPIRIQHGEPDLQPGEIVPAGIFGASLKELLAGKSIERATETEEA